MSPTNRGYSPAAAPGRHNADSSSLHPRCFFFPQPTWSTLPPFTLPPLSPLPICWFLVSIVKHLVQYLPQILSFQNSIHVSNTFNTNVMEQSRFELLPEALTPALGFFPPGIFNPVPYPIPPRENFAPWLSHNLAGAAT